MTTSVTSDYQAGAIAIVAVMRQLDQMLEGDCQETMAEHYRKHDAAVQALMAAAGPLPPRAAGVLAALAEIVVGERKCDSTYNFDVWQPESAMAPEEAAAQRRAAYEFEAAARHLERSNVVPLRR